MFLKKTSVFNLNSETCILKKAVYTMFYVLSKNPFGVEVKKKQYSKLKKEEGLTINLFYNVPAEVSYLSYPCPREVVKISVYASTFTFYYKSPMLVVGEISLNRVLNHKVKVKELKVVPGAEIIDLIENTRCLIYDDKRLDDLPRTRSFTVKVPKKYLQYALFSKEHNKCYYVFLGNLDRLVGW